MVDRAGNVGEGECSGAPVTNQPVMTAENIRAAYVIELRRLSLHSPYWLLSVHLSHSFIIMTAILCKMPPQQFRDSVSIIGTFFTNNDNIPSRRYRPSFLSTKSYQALDMIVCLSLLVVCLRFGRIFA